MVKMPDQDPANVHKSIHTLSKAHTEIKGVLLITPRLNMPGWFRTILPNAGRTRHPRRKAGD
jgi:hypothetical protein